MSSSTQARNTLKTGYQHLLHKRRAMAMTAAQTRQASISQQSFKMYGYAHDGALPENDTTSLDNYQFYKNEIPFQPYGVKIDEFQANWFGHHDVLESNHDYIQWLFPIRERGLNVAAQPLTKHEAELMRKDPEVLERFVKSYELILDFYGMKLINRKTGDVERNLSTYKERYEHLNESFHNYLRITRILKSLGILGFEHYKEKWIQFFIHEIFKNRELEHAQSSIMKYWLPTVRRPDILKELDSLVAKESNGVWYIDRRRDGYGSEAGLDNWATKLHTTNDSRYKI